MNNDTGILLIAVGHPIFGELAANCAMSLKANNCPYPVALASMPCALQTLPTGHLDGLFDRHLSVPNWVTLGEDGHRQWVKVKQYLDVISPFEKTLYIDADSLLLPNKSIESVMKLLSLFPFHPMIYGWGNMDSGDASVNYFWLNEQKDLKKLKSTFKLKGNRVYATNTSLVYFDRSKQSETVFKTVREVAANYPEYATSWRDGVPDEFLYMIGMCKAGIKTHIVPCIPAYIEVMERGILRNKQVQPMHIQKNYKMISMVGTCGDSSLQVYHNSLKSYVTKLNKEKYFAYRTKDDYIKHNPISKYKVQPDESNE